MAKIVVTKLRLFFRQCNRSFAGRAAIILVGSIAGQALVFLLLPFVARLYSADALGRAATTIAFLSIISLVLFMQYDQALIVAVDADVPYVLLLSLLISIIWLASLSLLLLLVVWFFPAGMVWLDMLGLNVRLLPLIASYSPFVLFTNYHLRRNALGRVSLGRMVYYGGGGLLQVFGGLLFGGYEATYLGAQTVAAIFAVISIFPYKKSWLWLKQHVTNLSLNVLELRRVAKAYDKFPRYQTLAQLLAAVSVNMTTIFMRVAFSAEWAGWYFVAWRILAAPTTLISQAIGQVFYRDIAETERQGYGVGNRVESMVYGLLRICLLPACAVGVLSPTIVRYALGVEWVMVGNILQALLIAFLVAFFTSPISNLLNVKEKQEKILIYFSLLFFGRVIALGIGWLLGTNIGSVWLYSLFSVIVLLPFSSDVIREMGGSYHVILRKLKPSLMDIGVLLLAIMGLCLLGWFDNTIGLAVFIILLLLAAQREIRRGGWGGVLSAANYSE